MKVEETFSPIEIRHYLDDPEILEGFNDGQRVEDLRLFDAIYLHVKGTGLFPVNVHGKIASIHAAIPRKNRGKKAIKAGKMAINWLRDKGYMVTCQVRKDRPDVMNYASLCGFKRISESDRYIIYIA